MEIDAVNSSQFQRLKLDLLLAFLKIIPQAFLAVRPVHFFLLSTILHDLQGSLINSVPMVRRSRCETLRRTCHPCMSVLGDFVTVLEVGRARQQSCSQPDDAVVELDDSTALTESLCAE